MELFKLPQHVDFSVDFVIIFNTATTFFNKHTFFRFLISQNHSTYTTSSLPTITVPALNPHFITGFVDAEGSFMIKIGKNSKRQTG